MFYCNRRFFLNSRVSFEVACREVIRSDSRQCSFEVHGQDGAANPHLRTMVSDTVQPAVVLSVSEGTLNAVALPLLFLNQRFEVSPSSFGRPRGLKEARTPRSFISLRFSRVPQGGLW